MSSERERIETEIATLSIQLNQLRDELDEVEDRDDDALPTAQHRRETLKARAAPTPPPRDEHTVSEMPPPPPSGSPRSLPPPNARVSFSTIPPLAEDEFQARYGLGDLLGQGGMGEVRHCVDRRIGRNVAIKIIKTEGARRTKQRARFLFEAKVQGQLEHPSIVPVYDIGVRPDGGEYFTMKRVHGRTLHEVIKGLKAKDKGVSIAFPLRRLLQVFQSVCQAVEFAHRRGVVHRDLKPANIMIGSLGEVSILDWGCAKMTERTGTAKPSDEARAALTEAKILSEDTGAGEVLGTPGYMSPEQAAGDPNVDAKSDVFALGAILFEILTKKYLVPGTSSAQVNANTLRGAYNAKISERFPEIVVPPELEETCVRATTVFAEERCATAMELYEAVDRYLDSDRDLVRRRSLSGQHTRAAIGALAELRDGKRKAGTSRELRATAVREVMRALAIDPENPTALRTMVKVMNDLPAQATPEAEAAIAKSEAEARPRVARRAALAYVMAGLNVAAATLLGVRSASVIGASCALFFAAALVGLVAWKRPSFARSPATPAAMLVLSCSAIALTSLLFGPFAYTPSLCAANVVAFAANVDKPLRKLAYACGVLAVLLPVVLQSTGLLPEAWSFETDRILVHPQAVSLPGLPSTILLLLEALGAILLPAVLVGSERDRRAAAERSLIIQANQLTEFIPTAAAPQEPA